MSVDLLTPQSLFADCDADGSGDLNIAELETALSLLGIRQLNALLILKEYSEGSGSLDLPKFTRLLQHLQRVRAMQAESMDDADVASTLPGVPPSVHPQLGGAMLYLPSSPSPARIGPNAVSRTPVNAATPAISVASNSSLQFVSPVPGGEGEGEGGRSGSTLGGALSALTGAGMRKAILAARVAQQENQSGAESSLDESDPDRCA